MRVWIAIWVGMVIVAGVVVMAWSNATKAYTHRYRMQVVVMVDGEEKTGSSVVEITWRKNPSILGPAPEYAPSIRGEAVVVDLGRDSALVALLHSGDRNRKQTPPFYLAIVAYGLPLSYKSIPEMQWQEGLRQLSGELAPTLILFSSASDPTSGSVIEPAAIGAFAPGMVLQRITLEVVTAPVTHTLDRALPWWNLPGRPAVKAIMAWQGGRLRDTVEPEALFRINQ